MVLACLVTKNPRALTNCEPSSGPFWSSFCFGSCSSCVDSVSVCVACIAAASSGTCAWTKRGDGCDLVSKHCRLSYVQVAYVFSAPKKKGLHCGVFTRTQSCERYKKGTCLAHAMLRFHGSISSWGCTQPHTTWGFLQLTWHENWSTTTIATTHGQSTSWQ